MSFSRRNPSCVDAWLLGCLISVLVSCQDNSELSPEYFPNTPGDSWTYEVTDSSQSTSSNPTSPKQYTVTVRITGAKKLVDGRDAMIWRYQYPWGYDTTFVRTTSDSIMVFTPGYVESVENLKYPRLLFITPFTIGDGWNGKLLYVDTLWVTDLVNLTTSAGNFNDCYNVDHRYLGPNIVDNDNYWFRPYLGMVKIYYDDSKFGPRQFRTWKLISYSLR